MREADPRTKKALQRLVRHETLQVKVLAADLGVSMATLYSWASPDGPVPSLSQCRQLVWAAAAYDQESARQLASDLFGIGDAGWFVAGAPRVEPGTEDVLGEVLQAGAALGAVSGWAADATADHQVRPAEADEGWRLIQKAAKELAEAAAVVQRFRPPQLSLRAVAP